MHRSTGSIARDKQRYKHRGSRSCAMHDTDYVGDCRDLQERHTHFSHIQQEPTAHVHIAAQTRARLINSYLGIVDVDNVLAFPYLQPFLTWDAA